MLNIFVSYSRQSEKIVKTLVNDIEALGHTAWFDQEISGGQSWWNNILSSVQNCDVFVFVLDPYSLSSHACKLEYSYANDLGKRILPVLISEEVQTNLLPPALSQIQFVDYCKQDRDAAFKLSRAFTTLPSASPLPDPLPPSPKAPISHLGGLHEQIESKTVLSYEEQSTLLVDLRQIFRDPKTRENAQVVLELLRKRRDLYASIAEEIDDLLGKTNQASLVHSYTSGSESTASTTKPDLRREAKYGLPTADLILYNRHYILGYSYYFRQAKWTLEVVDPNKANIERAEIFRLDYRIPPIFRADAEVCKGSGYDFGHYVSSVDHTDMIDKNTESFLLSNMCPRRVGFNRAVWKKLEGAIRGLDSLPGIYETFVVSGPIFYPDIPTLTLGPEDGRGATLPIPHAYFKSILAENNKGQMHMWSFIMPNEEADKPLEDFLVPTSMVERYAGLILWERLVGLVGRKIEEEKMRIRKMWKYN